MEQLKRWALPMAYVLTVIALAVLFADKAAWRAGTLWATARTALALVQAVVSRLGLAPRPDAAAVVSSATCWAVSAMIVEVLKKFI